MTGNLSLLAPAMIAVALSTALVGDETIYRSQLPDRGSAPAHRVRLSFPLLSSLRVHDAMARGPDHAAAQKSDDTGERLLLAPEVGLDDALEQLAESGVAVATVMEDGRPIGCLTTRDIMTVYRAALSQSVRRIQRLGPESELVEARLDAASPLAGQALRDVAFPADTLVVSIAREGETLFPKATTQLAAGDRLVLVTDRQGEAAVRAFLERRAEDAESASA
jgi:CIC family chloride channel protein